MPVSPLVVCDVRLHLVLNDFIWQEYPFNPGNLQPPDMESSSGKTTIKGAGGKHNCKLFRLKSSWRSGSDRERSVLPSDCFLFIFFDRERSNRNGTCSPETFLFMRMHRFTHEISPISPSHSGIILGIKVCEGQRRVSVTNADGCVNPGLSEPPGTHENNLEWYPHVVTCSPAGGLDLDGRSGDLKSDPAQCCVVHHKCQAKR